MLAMREDPGYSSPGFRGAPGSEALVHMACPTLAEMPGSPDTDGPNASRSAPMSSEHGREQACAIASTRNRAVALRALVASVVVGVLVGVGAFAAYEHWTNRVDVPSVIPDKPPTDAVPLREATRLGLLRDLSMGISVELQRSAERTPHRAGEVVLANSAERFESLTKHGQLFVNLDRDFWTRRPSAASQGAVVWVSNTPAQIPSLILWPDRSEGGPWGRAETLQRAGLASSEKSPRSLN